MRGGWQIGLIVGIDYTASNGDPKSAQSLHHMGPANQYEAAINSVGGILDPYDYDKKYPVFGFGGVPKFMGAQSVNHCFPLNGNPQKPSVEGIMNILQTYRQTIGSIQLSGPTFFGPILSTFRDYVQAAMQTTVYHVLLILTDGVIHDMPATRGLLVDLSVLPCSVIIVGVGSADFTNMRDLDGDNKQLVDDDGRPCSRDIVQFVEFNKAIQEGDLAEQVLREVP